MPVPSLAGVHKRPLLRDNVFESIRNAIVDGTFEPGERLKDTELEAWLGVSRTPIREALLRLERAGLIVALPGKATIVAPTNYPELVDMSQLLQADLKKIGVELDVQPLDPAQWYPKLNGGDYQMTFSFAGNSHKYPTRMALGTAFRLANNPLWPAGPPKAYADAVNAANGTLDPAEQKKAFDRIQEVMLDEAWNLSVAWRYTLFASQKYVKGLDWSVDDQVALDSVWLDK